MASLIKNALVKQISKFLKNVTSNQINISTLKGEGEMRNIELDENVLMDLIELPTWLKITSAKCNKANVKIQWTKLKTNPIIIFLDKIELDMEIADPIREYKASDSNSKLFDKDTGAYGFIDKCIDAIQLNIDSITITIKSKIFNANLNISNIYVYSVTPNWKITNDIRNTRLKDLEKDEIILFKEISWEICRLEAFNVEPENQTQSSIKLIMNPSKIQIAMKKKLSNKTLINSTVKVLLNEIYWSANDTQLKSAIGTYKSLSKLMNKSFIQKRKYASYQQQHSTQNKSTTPQSSVKNHMANEKASNIDISKVFLQYDIKETSLHLHISILNIHLYADDNYSGNKLIDGGAMQFLFKNMCIDHYPYHRVGSSTKHWNNYNHTFKQRETWSKNLINEFLTKLETILNKTNITDIKQIKLKNSINLLESCTLFNLKDFLVYKVTTNVSNKQANVSSMKTKKSKPESVPQTSQNYQTPNDFIKMKTYFLEQQMFNSRPFLSSNFTEFNLPSDTLFASFFFSEFYFPEDINYPIPSPQIFAQVSPILLNIDFLTLLWINTLAFSLWREKLIVDQNSTPENFNKSIKNESTSKIRHHVDTYFELIMPKINLSIYPKESKDTSESFLIYEDTSFEQRPNGLEIGFARVCLSNQTMTSSHKNLTCFKSTSDKCYEISKLLLEKKSKFKSNFGFDSDEIKINSLAPCFNQVIKNENFVFQRYDLSSDDDIINTVNEAENATLGLFLKSLNKNALNKCATKDVWIVEIESMWLDMYGPKENESFNLIQNASFKVYTVQVWDFYNSSLCKISQEIHMEKAKEFNFKKAYQRLEKLIEIDPGNRHNVIENQRRRSSSFSMPSSETKSQYIFKNIYSKFNIITEINDIQINCDHSQILFLLRLVDTIDIFLNQIKIDSEQTLKYRSKNNECIKDEKNTTRIKSLKLEDLNNLDRNDSNEIDNEQTSINFALLVNNIDVNLSINDLRKNIKFKQQQLYIENRSSAEASNYDQNQTSQIKKFINQVKEENDNSIEISCSEKLVQKDDYEIISKQSDKEFMLKYIKYIYGLSAENPNNGSNFHSSLNNLPNNSINNFLNNSNDSGFQTSEKSSLSVSFSSKNLSSKFSRLTAKLTEPSDNDTDLFIDDNDNLTVILGLEQDDTSSIISDAPNFVESIPNISTNIEKLSPSQSISSTSEASSFTTTTNLVSRQFIANDLERKETNSSSRIVLNKNQLIQTNQVKTDLKIKIYNLNFYLQSNGDNMEALIRLEQIELRNKRSCLNPSKNEKDDEKEILVRFKKLVNDPVSVNGLLEVKLENLKLDTDIATITGLVELVDDNDNYEKELKENLPINIQIINSNFRLVEDPFDSYENNPKLINISIDKLVVNKLADNSIILNEINLNNNESNLTNMNYKYRKLSASKDNDFSDQLKNDLPILDMNLKFNFNSNQFASLVYLLRRSKEDYQQLKLKYEKEIEQEIKEKDTILHHLKQTESENHELKKEIEKLRQLANNSKNEIKSEINEEQARFLDTDNNETSQAIRTLEIERKQFESLLKGFQEENEFLKSKLKKSEDYISLLNIERASFMKKLNEKF